MLLDETTIFSVSQLNQQVRDFLENRINMVRVEGEISNLSTPSSGHLYFSLKDSSAQIRCAFFKHRHRLAKMKALQNGQKIVVMGKVTLYEVRGDYQLQVYDAQEAGLGDLHQQFERLKAALLAKGLFDPARKKPIPQYPKKIGIVTSKHAAALQDILTTLARRYPLANIQLYPSEVQGKQAPQQLVHALNKANQEACCDVLILARGGGSLEDLWAFNDERLAYTIADSNIPIVTGVGHDVDVTIADFVADVRAATPTAAAETVTPDRQDLLAFLSLIQSRLHQAVTRLMEKHTYTLAHLTRRLQSPQQRLEGYAQSLDYLEKRMTQAIQQGLAMASQRLSLQSRALEAVSPLATLSRGYAIATAEGHVLTDSAAVKPGDNIIVTLAKGNIGCEVLKRNPEHA